MRADHPIEDLAQAIHSACLRDLPDVVYERPVPQKVRPRLEWPREKCRRRPLHYEIEVLAMFCQSWENTSIGLDKDGGIAGQAFTDAYTIIVGVRAAASAAVYFGGQPAYMADMDEVFRADMAARQMVRQSQAAERYKGVTL